MSNHHHAPHHPAPRHDHPAHHDGHDSHADQSGLPDLLDLDAATLEGPLSLVRSDIAALTDAPVRTILDLGAGTGTGTFGLLRHFPDASALAVDGSSEMLEHLERRAADLGLADRVSTLQADLDEDLPLFDAVAAVDLAWASASLHHLADPDRTLAQVVPAIRPGGLLAVLELTGFPRFLGDDSPEGAAEARTHALLASDRAVDMPAMASDWASRLSRAGLVVELDRAVVVDLAPPLADGVGEYAYGVLSRVRGAVADRLSADELGHLDRLLDGGPDDVRRRSDLRVRTERRLCVARRPVAD